MAEPNKYLEMSAAERARQRELLDQADAATDAVKHVAATIALKWAMEVLKGAKDSEGNYPKSKLGSGWSSISPQMMPKESLMAKPAGLSETQVDGIKKSVEKALGAIKL